MLHKMLITWDKLRGQTSMIQVTTFKSFHKENQEITRDCNTLTEKMEHLMMTSVVLRRRKKSFGNLQYY